MSHSRSPGNTSRNRCGSHLGRGLRLAAFAGLAPLVLPVFTAAPVAHAADAAQAAAVSIEVLPFDNAATISWDADNQPQEVTQVIVDVTDGADGDALVNRSVLPVEEAKAEIGGLKYEHDYTVRVQTLADGVAVASSTASLRTVPVLASFALQPVVPSTGARLPYTLGLTRAASTDVTAVVTPTDGPLDLTPFEVTIPAGSRTVDGTIPLNTAGIGADDVPFVAAKAVLKGVPDGRSQQDYFYLPPVNSDPVTATISVPSTVAEPPAGEQGSIPVTVTLDGPSPGVSYDFQAYRADLVGHPSNGDPMLRADLVVPKGARSATIDVPIDGDAAPAGDVTWLIDYRFPRYVTGSMPHNTTAQVTVLDDDAPAPDLVVTSPLYSWGLPAVGRLSARSVHWVNRGAVTAEDVRLTGEITGGSPKLRVITGRAECTITRSGASVAYSCPIGDVAPGAGGAVEIEDAATAPGEKVTTAARLVVDDDPTQGDLEVSMTRDVEGPACTIIGEIGPDQLTGTSGDDVVCGPQRTRGAPDVVVPGAGNDTLLVSGVIDYSGAPKGIKVMDDFYEGATITGWGTDQYPISLGYVTEREGTTLRATRKNDTIRVLGRLGVEAGAGNDRVFTDEWAFTGRMPILDGGDGTDILTVYTHGTGVTIRLGEQVRGFERLVTGAGRQTVFGSTGADDIRTGADADTVRVSDGIAGNDTVNAGAGDDTCVADKGDSVTGCEHVTWVPVS